jgi:hypothetical protein
MDAAKLLDKIMRCDLIFETDYRGAEPCTQLLQRMAMGDGDSWILPWMATAIAKNQVTLFPQQSLVSNEGLQASGIGKEWMHLFESSAGEASSEVGTITLEVDAAAIGQLRMLFLRWRSAESWKRRLYNCLMRFFPLSVDRYLYSTIVRRSLQKAAETNL